MYIYLEFSVYRESMCTHFYVNKKNLLNLSHDFRVFFFLRLFLVLFSQGLCVCARMRTRANPLVSLMIFLMYILNKAP